MVKQAASEIISAISETTITLKTPLRQLVEKDFKERVVLSKYLPNSEENIQALSLCCLYKAKGCKQIELDFFDSLLFTFDECLNQKLETIQLKLAKHYAISLGTCDSHSEKKPPILLEYISIIKFLHELLNKPKLYANDIVKEKSLDFLIFYLDNKANAVSYEFAKNLEILFSYILSLIESKYNSKVNDLYVKNLDSLEKTEFFSQLSTEIKLGFYQVVYEVEGLILYKTLLANLVLLVEQAFKDNLALTSFDETRRALRKQCAVEESAIGAR